MHDQNSSPDLKSALLRVLETTVTLPAQVTLYAAALGAIALIPGADLPPALTTLASGVGVNVLSSLLECVARGEQVSDNAIRQQVQKAIEESHIAEQLAGREIQAMIARQFRRLDLLQFAIQEKQYDVLQQLTEQAAQFDAFLAEWRDEAQKLATREQSDQIIAQLQDLIYLMNATIPVRPGTSPSAAVYNQLLLRQKFINWSIRTNRTISIPSLNIALPMSKAWIHLRAMLPSDAPGREKSLEEQIKEYHEWHRLADATDTLDRMDIESVADRERLLVVVGGPGAGKSTLLRRLAWAWSAEGQSVPRVSLRKVNLRMSQGETFDEALLAVAADGFQSAREALYDIFSDATHLLADGLDETDPNRSGIADCLQRWAFANPERRVVLTTRPIGHNPAWFEEWKHFELLPLVPFQPGYD